MEKKNEGKTMNEGRKQCPSCIDERTKMLLNWYHGSTTRFINDAASICGSGNEKENAEKRAVFTAFIANELVRLGQILDIEVATPTDSPAEDNEEHQYFDDDDMEDTVASEEIYVYQDILADKISEIARLRTQVSVLNGKLAELELANQK